MLSQEIRRRFLGYFKKQGHALIPSSAVVPHDDPTLLFNNAGMNQFKDIFLGKSQRDYQRAATAQKCIRVGGKHNDLDNVGHTSRHLTFFEMLGNFSFGDYFKEKAIQYAWEVSTGVFGFAPEKIWITVFQDDDEAAALWERFVPKERIVRLGEKDNFWAMGETGPCGPCSELLFDRGASYGSAVSPKEDASGERYLEFWNLVFMQYNRDGSGKLTPLPKQSIDTGAGLERVVSLKMGVDSVFATDIFIRLIAEITALSGVRYTGQPSFHVIADHIRALAFAIADGAQPSNVERGYVLRKLLRRAVRYGRTLGMQEPFLARILPALIETMGPDYPELTLAQGRIAEILTLEEESFLRTLKRGGNILQAVIERSLHSPLKQINGEDAFKLKDTYGLPLEEILLIAKDNGLQVNLEAYELLSEKAKELSRTSHQVASQVVEESLFKDYVAREGPSLFVGYEQMEAAATIKALIRGGQNVAALVEGEEGIVLLDTTPFYAERGGQVGDIGSLEGAAGSFAVSDCQMPYKGVVAHIGMVKRGALKIGEKVTARIDVSRRQAISNNHTATHLLHWALQHVLGSHIRQAGSLVEPLRLRFDFNHHKPLSLQEIAQIEDLVNEKIRTAAPVKAYEIAYEEVQKDPDIKQFFGDKYDSRVRVIDIDFSKELCGGTHVEKVGSIGYFRIAKESSIAAGVRRIEALTGKEAEHYAREHEAWGQRGAQLLKTPLANLKEQIEVLLEESQQLKKELKKYKQQEVLSLAKEVISQVEVVHGVPFLALSPPLGTEDVAFLTEALLQLQKSVVLVIALKGQKQCTLFVRITPDLVRNGLQAVDLIKEIAPSIGGSGGGRAESAQAGGKEAGGIPMAFAKARQWLEKIS